MTRSLKSVFASIKAALMRRCRSSHEAEDLMQEAWVRLAAFEQGQPVPRPEAFPMRAALTLSIDAHRLAGLSCTQIARARGISINAVEHHAAKALLLLCSMEGW